MSRKRAKQQRRTAHKAEKQRLGEEKALYCQTLFDLFDQATQPLKSPEESLSPPSHAEEKAHSSDVPSETVIRRQGANYGLLGSALSAAVPLRLLECYNRGIIEPWEFGSAQAFGQILASEGDKLLFRSKQKGETARLFNGLAKAIALLAFVPGGIALFDQRFDARAFLSAWIGTEPAETFCQTSLQRFYDELVTCIPAICSLAHSDRSLGTWNVLSWFETASNEDLLQLRAQKYCNCSDDGQILPEQVANHIIQEIFRQAEREVQFAAQRKSPNAEAALRLSQAYQVLEVRDTHQPLACFIEPASAEKWLHLFRHELITGRSWDM